MKIRIAVARDVAQPSRWNAAGWANTDDDELIGIAADSLDAVDVAYYWIEAELPDVPPIPVVQGITTPETP